MPKFKTKAEWTFNWRGLDELGNRFDQAKQRIERLTEEIMDINLKLSMAEGVELASVLDAARFCLHKQESERMDSHEVSRAIPVICREYMQMVRWQTSHKEVQAGFWHRVEKCLEVLQHYFTEGQDGWAALKVLREELECVKDTNRAFNKSIAPQDGIPKDLWLRMQKYMENLEANDVTLRDYFAAKAMAVVNEQNLAPTPLHSDVARDAYALADAMLAARRKAVEQISTKEVSNPSG